MSPLPLELPTVAPVMSLLWGVAGRWKEIAEGLEFVEDLIDEIDDNNDMDEGCLQHCGYLDFQTTAILGETVSCTERYGGSGTCPSGLE